METYDVTSYGLFHQNPYMTKALMQWANVFSSTKEIAMPLLIRAMHYHVKALAITLDGPGCCEAAIATGARISGSVAARNSSVSDSSIVIFFLDVYLPP
jgi:hypothetical protein